MWLLKKYVKLKQCTDSKSFTKLVDFSLLNRLKYFLVWKHVGVICLNASLGLNCSDGTCTHILMDQNFSKSEAQKIVTD